MSGSIVDDPTPAKAEDDATPVNAQDLADMLFMVFEAVKDLEAEFQRFRRDFGYEQES